MKVGSLFSGIGGFDLGLERAGMEISWQVEIDDYCRKVLAKHWPDVPKFGDIRECGAHNLGAVDLVCGGFPCQPFSTAGKQSGKEDHRYLWPEMLRVVSETGARWVIGENVPGIIHLELDNVLSDLEGIGYTTWTAIIPAVGVDARHKRDRVWIVAYSESNGDMREPGNICSQDGGSRNALQRFADCASDVSNANGSGLKEQRSAITTPEEYETVERCSQWESEPGMGRVANGIPNRVDRVKGLGNAVVPQIPEIFGRIILQIEN